MALKGKWVDKVNGVDMNNADDINQVAQAVIELEGKTDAIKAPTKLSELTGDATHRTVTDAEKTSWNAKLGQSDLQAATNAALKQAKESGEFDGNDYVLTDADKDEIKADIKAYVDDAILGGAW